MTEQEAVVTPLDPYVNLAEHGRQSRSGTHTFDPGCYFCLRLYWEDQQDAATPRLGMKPTPADLRAAVELTGLPADAREFNPAWNRVLAAALLATDG